MTGVQWQHRANTLSKSMFRIKSCDHNFTGLKTPIPVFWDGIPVNLPIFILSKHIQSSQGRLDRIQTKRIQTNIPWCTWEVFISVAMRNPLLWGLYHDCQYFFLLNRPAELPCWRGPWSQRVDGQETDPEMRAAFSLPWC